MKYIKSDFSIILFTEVYGGAIDGPGWYPRRWVSGVIGSSYGAKMAVNDNESMRAGVES